MTTEKETRKENGVFYKLINLLNTTEKEMIEKRDSDLEKIVNFIVEKITKLEYKNLKCYNSENGYFELIIKLGDYEIDIRKLLSNYTGLKTKNFGTFLFYEYEKFCLDKLNEINSNDELHFRSVYFGYDSYGNLNKILIQFEKRISKQNVSKDKK